MKKIILAESDPEAIDLYRRVFEKTGFDVELASQKDEMLEELRQIRIGVSPKPDLVLMDLRFSDGQGIEVLKAIKKHFITRDIPVFAVTNYQNPDLDQEAARQGIAPEKYLIKADHTPAQLIGVINEYFRKTATARTTFS
jgi:CheY-like chemotaxis protein